jgi:hypothetical protein
MRSFVFFSLVVWCLFFLACSAQATTLVERELSEVVQESAWVGRVTILSMDANQDGRTVIRARAREVYKGDLQANQEFIFQVPGGLKNQKRLVVLGMLSFKPDEEVILFLATQPGENRLPSVQDWRAYSVTSLGRVVRKGAFTHARQRNGQWALSHDQDHRLTLGDFVTEIYRGMD